MYLLVESREPFDSFGVMVCKGDRFWSVYLTLAVVSKARRGDATTGFSQEHSWRIKCLASSKSVVAVDGFFGVSCFLGVWQATDHINSSPDMRRRDCLSAYFAKVGLQLILHLGLCYH